MSNLLRAGDLADNTFPEQVLRPGETLRLETWTYDVGGLEVHVQPLPDSLPAQADWTPATGSGLVVPAVFNFTPAAADAGSLYAVHLQVWSAQGTNVQTWSVYVPTPVEQVVFINEFLANPVSDTNSPAYNPLQRSLPWTNSNLGTWDEYVEIANLSAADVDLWNWSLSDAVRVRHRFYTGGPGETLYASNAIVVYGGPLNGSAPNLPVPVFPASESSAGLALNNTGTELILLRNQDGNLVDRVIYAGSNLPSGSSLTRFPGLNGAFVPQAYVGPVVVSPGRQSIGTPFNVPVPAMQGVGQVTLSLDPAQTSITLAWPASPGQVYTLWRADDVAGPFIMVAGGPATNSAGQFIDRAPALSRRFYFLTTP